MLGWRAELKAMEGMDYTLFKASDTMVGGMVAMDEQWPDDIPPHWMIYFSVNDCDAQAEQAKKLGGEVCVQPMDAPEVGRFCVLTDPQGAVFSIINLNQ